jgi:hypothetical protein
MNNDNVGDGVGGGVGDGVGNDCKKHASMKAFLNCNEIVSLEKERLGKKAQSTNLIWVVSV